jgi:hypothetical protein
MDPQSTPADRHARFTPVNKIRPFIIPIRLFRQATGSRYRPSDKQGT